MSSTISSTLSWCNKGQSVKKIKKDSRASLQLRWRSLILCSHCMLNDFYSKSSILIQDVPVLYCKSRLYWNKQSNISKQTTQKKNHAFDITCFKWIPDKRLLYKITTTYLSIIEGLNFSVPIDTLDKLLPSLIYFVSDKESIKKGIQTSLAIHFFKTCSVFL